VLVIDTSTGNQADLSALEAGSDWRSAHREVTRGCL